MSEEARIRELLDASSLGTPAAKALIARTTPEEVEKVRQRMRELEEESKTLSENPASSSPSVTPAEGAEGPGSAGISGDQ